MKKRILSILLSIIMLLGMLPVTAPSAFAAGVLTPDGDDVYHIASSDNWGAFDSMVKDGNAFAGKTVVLDNDIAVSTPVGDWDAKKAFSGTFDGNDNTIIFTNTESTSNKGVFGYTIGAKISNLIVYGEISGIWSLGGVVGCANSTEITNCENYAQITSIAQNDEAYVGGIVGVSEGNVTISDCGNFGNVSGNYSVGGIIGETRANDIVKNCTNLAEVVGKKNNVGGIVGNAAGSATILNCINVGAVSGKYYVDGIVGHTGGNQVVVENCCNNGSITANVEYTVTFNMMGHGTNIPDQTVVSDGKVTKPADPTEDGYTLDGWYKDENCTVEWNFATDTVKANTTLYAKWTAVLPVLEDGYYLVGTINGVNFWDVSSLTSDMKLVPSGTDDEYKLDWTFYEGDRVKVVKVKDGVITVWYHDGEDNSYTISTERAGEGTLYFRPEGNAEWSYFFLTVTPSDTPEPSPVINVYFNMQGHGAEIDSQNVEEGGKVRKPADPTASGYKFDGWYKEAQCINEWNFETNTVTATTTLYAKWTVGYNVRFILMGGSGGTATVDAYPGEAMPEITVPTREGYTFDGYYDANGVKYYNADGTSAKNWDKTTDSEILIAVWTPSGSSHEHIFKTDYIWNEDLTTCTAIKTCGCGNAVIETVDTVKNGNTVTATFTTDGFTEQTKTVEEVEDEAAKALKEAKTAAKAVIDNTVKSADDDIKNYGEAAKGDIDKLTTITAVTEKLTAALAEINNMKTAKAITAALKELDNAASNAVSTKSKAIAATAKSLIEDAESADEANAVLSEALKKIAGEEKTLSDAKTAAKAAVDSAAGSKQSEAMKKIVSEVKAAIDSAKSLEEVENAKQAGLARIEAQKQAEKPTEPTKPSDICSKCGGTHPNNFWGQIVCFFNRVINWFKNLFN